MTSGKQEMFLTWKTEEADFNIKKWNYLFFVIFLGYIFKIDYNKSKDMVKTGWKCIFDFAQP